MFVEREAELHSWNDWYDIHARLELRRPELITGLSLPWLIFNARDVAGNLQPTVDYLTSPKSDSLSECLSTFCKKNKTLPLD